jgi:hypothetical protein
VKTNVPANIAATTTIGFHAVAQHMLDYDLPAPYGIDSPNACSRAHDAILVSVPSTALDAWLETIVVDDEDTRPSDFAGYTKSTYIGRLPDTGVRVHVLVSRKATELRAVTS